MIDRLLTIRKKQLKIFEDLTMFEQRILCHKLPNSFNPITINDNKEQCVNKHNKMVQDLKRQMLNAELEQYELKIQHYEHLYEQELATFQSEIYKTVFVSNLSLKSINIFCQNLYISSYKTFTTSNSLKRILLSCQINTPSSSSPSLFYIKQHYQCPSTNNCRCSKSLTE
jgi:cell fate regulator YaaT (PSP1 superfamily)